MLFIKKENRKKKTITGLLYSKTAKYNIFDIFILWECISTNFDHYSQLCPLEGKKHSVDVEEEYWDTLYLANFEATDVFFYFFLMEKKSMEQLDSWSQICWTFSCHAKQILYHHIVLVYIWQTGFLKKDTHRTQSVCKHNLTKRMNFFMRTVLLSFKANMG